jgi:hypothetical protein
LTVRPESTDLKAEIAACWKVFWSDEPLPFSVPLAAADVGLEPAPVVAELGGELVLDEQAAARRVTRTAPPAATTCFLPRSCISGFSLLGIAFLAHGDQPGDPVGGKSRVRYSLAAESIHA